MGIESRTSATEGQASSTAEPIAYSVCCSDSEWCAVNVASSARRASSNGAEPSWRQRAETAVASTRSEVSASVVYLSRGKPWNSESVVFKTTRSDSPETNHEASPSRITVAIRCSRAACVNAWSPSRAHGDSMTSTRARATASTPAKCSASRKAKASGVPIGASLAKA